MRDCLQAQKVINLKLPIPANFTDALNNSTNTDQRNETPKFCATPLEEDEKREMTIFLFAKDGFNN